MSASATKGRSVPRAEPSHGFGVFLLVGVSGAFVTAFVYIAVIWAWLPPTDLAYGESVFTALSNPFVIVIAGPVTLVSGLLASPLLFGCLRSRRLAVALPLVFTSVLATVALLTPFSPRLGLFGSYVALVVSTLVCTRIQATAYS